MKDTEIYYSRGYKQGYADGYRAGVEDAQKGISAESFEGAVTKLPIDAMEISARARNCLRMAGCRFVSDVIALDGVKIARMRNLGSKTAQEIAGWLNAQDVPYNPWYSYL